MRRIVVDTSTVVAGLQSRNGAGFVVLGLIAERVVVPLLTIALVLEYEDVLKRPEQIEAHGRSADDIDAFLGELAALAEPVDIRFQWRPQTSDPGDECILEAAVNGRADAIVSHNIRDLADPARRFGVPVLRPGEFIMRFRP
jgi:putative PIN family toxin of toxin-antitoxin system